MSGTYRNRHPDKTHAHQRNFGEVGDTASKPTSLLDRFTTTKEPLMVCYTTETPAEAESSDHYPTLTERVLASGVRHRFTGPGPAI